MAENFAAFGTPIDIGASTPLAPPDFSKFASPINIGNSTPLDASSEPMELPARRNAPAGATPIELPAGDLGPAFTYPKGTTRRSAPPAPEPPSYLFDQEAERAGVPQFVRDQAGVRDAPLTDTAGEALTGAPFRTGGSLLDKAIGSDIGMLSGDQAYQQQQARIAAAEKRLAETKARKEEADRAWAETVGTADVQTPQDVIALQATRARLGVAKTTQDLIEAEGELSSARKAGLPTQGSLRDTEERALRTGISAGTDIVTAARGLAEQMRHPQEADDPEFAAEMDRARAQLRKRNEDMISAANRLAIPDPTQDEAFRSKLAEGATSMALFMAGGLAARALSLPGAVGSAGLGAFQMGGQALREVEGKIADAVARGDQREVDRLAQVKYLAMFANMGLGATEAIPLERFMNRLNQATGNRVAHILLTSGKQSLEEVIQEVGQQIGQNVVAKLLYEDRDLFKDVRQSGEVAMVLGLLMGAGAGMSGRRPLQPGENLSNWIEETLRATQQVGQLPTAGELAQGVAVAASGPGTSDQVLPSTVPPDVSIPAGAVPATNMLQEAPDDRENQPGLPGEIGNVGAQPVETQPVEGGGGAPVGPGGIFQGAQAVGPAPQPVDQAGAGVAAAPVVSPPGTDITSRDTLERLLNDPRSAAEIRAEMAAARAEAEAARNWRPTEEWAPIPRAALALVGDNPSIEFRWADSGAIQARTAPKPGSREAPVKLEAPTDVHAGAEQTAQPTPAQAEAGNYAKRHVKWNGFDISIENEAGSVRSGVGADGKPWSVTMPAPYGYIRRTEGKDGDQLDITIGPNPQSGTVYVVDQVDPNTNKFDETKSFGAFDSEADAVSAYYASFSDGSGPARLGAITAMPVAQYRTWVDRGNHKKPVAYREPKLLSVAPRGPTGPLSLLQFLAANGGLKADPGGELKSLGITTRSRLVVPGLGFRSLIRATGMDLDHARELAVENGYLHDPGRVSGGLSQSTPNDLLRLLGEELHGRRTYAQGEELTDLDQQAARAREIAQERLADAVADVTSVVEEHNLLADDAQVREAAELTLTQGIDAEDAITTVLERASLAVIDEGAQSLPQEPRHAEAADHPRAVGEGEGGAPAVEQPARQGRAEAPAAPRRVELGEDQRDAGAQGQVVAQPPRVEPGADNNPQLVIPGAEKISNTEQAQRGAEKSLRPKVAQKAADEGLFDEGSKQSDLVDMARRPKGPFDVTAPGEIPRGPVSLGPIYRGAEGGADPRASLRYFKDGDLGDGVYLTHQRWLAETYGGGPDASIKKGTRKVFTYEVPGTLRSTEVAYAFGGRQAGTDIQIVRGDGTEVYNGPWKVESIEKALQAARGIKVVIGTPDSVGLNQIAVRDPTLLTHIEPAAPDDHGGPGKTGASIVSEGAENWWRSDLTPLGREMVAEAAGLTKGQAQRTAKMTWNNIAPAMQAKLAAVRGTDRDPVNMAKAPTWAEVMAALPRASQGNRDVELATALMREISGKQSPAYRDLTPSQRHELLARVKDAAERAAATPSEKPKARPPATRDWTKVGKNAIGQTLYEDQNGVRSYIENGVRHVEPVAIRPTRAGVAVEKPVHRDEWLLTSEQPAAEQSKAEAIDADVKAAFDDIFGKEEAPKAAAPRTPRTKSELASSAAKNLGRGTVKSIDALGKLFGGKNRLGSGPTFDEETWTQAKPLFLEAARDFAGAWKDVAELARLLVDELKKTGYGMDVLRNMRPYLERFVQDVKTGTINLKSAQKASEKAADPMAALSDRFAETLRNHEGFATIVQARAVAKEMGLDLDPKSIDEAMERAVVTAAREIVRWSSSPQQKFKALLNLYESQPKLSTRTSTQMRDQAFSTPVPLAYVASRLAKIGPDTWVIEPSAGNGALLIEAEPRKGIVNEINPQRADALEEQGFRPDRADATGKDFTRYEADRVIANPPFGAVRQEGASKVFDMGFIQPGYRTHEIDHAIALRALQGMKDDGRAVLIVGGLNKLTTTEEARSDGYNSKAKREFYKTLYDHYRVTDHFTVAGELYERQGAGWPVDVIVIEGRGKSSLPLPAVAVPRIYTSWDQIAELLHAERRPDGAEAGQPVAGGAAVGTQGDHGGVREAGERQSELPARPIEPGGVGSGRDERSGNAVAGAQEPARSDRGGGEPAGPDLAPATERRPPRVEHETERQVAYTPKSGKANSLGTLVPVNMRTSVSEALDAVAKAEGDIDDFVARELGYKPEELSRYFAAEQIDSLALALSNIKRGKGFIIGDQCVAGETRIYDPETGKHTTIRDLAKAGKPINVLALTRNGLRSMPATTPFLKGTAGLYRVTLDDGRSICATAGHRFLTHSGWRSLGDGLREGHFLASAEGHPACSLDDCPSVHREDARRCSDTVRACRDHYPTSRSCDARSQSEAGSDRASFPSPDDVLGRSRCCSHEGGRGTSQGYSRPSPSSGRRAKNSSSPSWSRDPLPICIPASASPASVSRLTPRSAQPSHGAASSLHQGCGVALLDRREDGGARSVHHAAEPQAPRRQGIASRDSSSRPLLSTPAEGPRQHGKSAATLPPVRATALPCAFPFENHTGWRRIVKVEFERTDEFFDMIVPGAANYVAEGFINHNTGIGKGRVNAAVIRWAIKNGRIPVFVTEKANLFSDMYRDLTDIGIQQFLNGREPRVLATNAGLKLPLSEDGKVRIANGESVKHNGLLNSLTGNNLREHYDMVFTNYSQMQTVKGQDTARRRFLTEIAPHSVVIFDESHNAGGQGGPPVPGKAPDRAGFSRELAARANGVFYSSATYAKRPDVMDLYSATDMTMAVDDPSKLGEAIARGGVPMQQVVASMLAKAGQYIRRERSFAGVNYDTPVVKVDHAQYDGISRALAAIQAFSVAREGAVKNIAKGIKAEAQSVSPDGSTGGAGASSINFTSIMHNLIGQMLLSLKVAPAAEMAIEALKAGQKPVITLANTMESFLNDYAGQMGVEIGQAVDGDFSKVLKKYLERTREITIKKPFQRATELRRYLTDEELGGHGLRAYKAALAAIDALDLSNLSLSPIDALKSRIEKAGYKVGEITGRTSVIDFSDKYPILRARPGSERSIAGRRATITKFNNGDLDVVILNQAGSTGISLHASEKFRDQRQRHMIIAQAEANIDTHMQMLGRVHRTGQVVVPTYSQLIADIPAEKRPAAVLAKKMASLNASTTASRGGALTAKDVPDFINIYGDMVAIGYLTDDPLMWARLGNPVHLKESGGYEADDAMRKLTGRIPLLSLKEQEALYEHLEAEYDALLKQMDAAGENALEAKTLDLQARRTASAEVVPPRNASSSPFAGPVSIDKVSVRRLGKPMKPEEVVQRVAEGLSLDPGTVTAENAAQRLADFNTLMSEGDDVPPVLTNFETYKRSILDDIEKPDRQEAERVRLDAVADRWKTLEKMLRPGFRVTLRTSSGNLTGITLRVEQKGKPKNPLALSTWKATIAIADASRQITIPFSRLYEDAKSPQDDPIAMEVVPVVDWVENAAQTLDRFAHMQADTREQRYIATGNLLAAYEWLNAKGRIVNYTDESGAIRQGILTPSNFEFEKHAAAKGRVMSTPAEVGAWLDAHPGKSIESDDGIVRLSRRQGQTTIAIARAKNQGGIFFLDKPLADIVGDFTLRGGLMTAAANSAKFSDAVARLQALGARFSEPGAAPDMVSENGLAEPEQPYSTPEPRLRGVPAAASEPIATFKNDQPLKRHPGYKAAKAGDAPAAERLVEALVKDENVEAARKRFGADAIYVPVIAQEQTGDNAIPDALAGFYAARVGGTSTSDIVQANQAFHTGAGAMERIANRAMFDGPVERGKRYVLVDDVSVMGSTLADLADHIQRGGGEVIGVVTLANAGRSGVLTPSPATIRDIERRFGDAVQDLFGIAPASLTADEAAYLRNFKDADALRARRAAAEVERAARLGAKGIRPEEVGPGKSDENDSGPGGAASDSGPLGFSQEARPVTGFYSAVLRAVENVKLSKAPAAQWLNTIRNAPGVKAEELKWLGLEDWLKEQTGAITKEQVTDFVRANQIEVQEVEKGEKKVGWRREDLLPDGTLASDTKYGEYTLAGGENYRELLLTLPGIRGATHPGTSNTQFGRMFADDGTFRSSHWDEPNIVAHVRFNDRTIDGKRTLFVEEVQSDWHQAGKRRGYTDLEAEKAAQARADDAMQRAMAINAEMEKLAKDRHPTTNQMVEERRWHHLAREREAAQAEMEQASASIGGRIPDAPFKTTWPELAFKRMIRYAAENGYEQIAWTPGNVQAERYDLSKHLEHVRYRQNNDGTYRLDATPRGESTLIDIADHVAAERLPDYVGKDLAEKIVAGEGDADRFGNRTIYGADLKVGGGGMTAFYDRILPATVNKLGKKYGAKVGQSKVVAATAQDEVSIVQRGSHFDVVDDLHDGLLVERFDTRADAERFVAEEGGPREHIVHTLPITPELRAAALGEGFALFQGEKASADFKYTDLGPFRIRDGDQIGKLAQDYIVEQGREAGVEFMLAFDQDGNVLSHGHGDKTSIGISPALQQALMDTGREIVVHHNHPSDVGLSIQDFTMLALPGMRAIWAHGHAGAVVRAELTPAAKAVFSSKTPSRFNAVVRAVDRALFQRLSDDIGKGRITTARANAIHHHLIGTVLAEAGIIEYNSNIDAAAEVAEPSLRDYLSRTADTARRSTYGTDARLDRGATALRQHPADVGAVFGTGPTATGRRSDQAGNGGEGAGGGRAETGRGFAADQTRYRGIAPITPETPASERAQAAQGFIARGQPIDRAIRVPFDLFGGTTPDGRWRPGIALYDRAAHIITGARFSDAGRFTFMNPFLDTVRGGLVDRYTLRNLPGYVEREKQRALDERGIMLEGAEILKLLKEHNVGPAEARVLQAILTGEDVSDADMEALAEPIRAAIDQLGQEAVALGLLSRESFERNRGAYLHRVYQKYEADQNGLTRMVNTIMGRNRQKIIGDQFRGRGMFHEIALARLMRDVPGWQEAERGRPQHGERFIRLDELADQGELELDGDAPPQSVMRTVWWPADRNVPDRYSGFRRDGMWEVRGDRGGKLVLWRDFTKPEREHMGEILDARYTIGKTFMLMAHDLATGRFYKDIAENEDWASSTQPEGRSIDAGEWQRQHRRLRGSGEVEWVRVPDVSIPDSGGKKRYGALAGKWVREEIWRDINEIEVMSTPHWWRTLLTQWKLNKTARSPVVHMNNVMSNFLLMDMMDVRFQDFIAGVRSYASGDEHYEEAFRHGAFGTDMISQEVRKNVLEPILDELGRAGTFGGAGARIGAFGQVSRFTGALWARLKQLDTAMLRAYQIEDDLFKMAAYMRRRQLGDSPEQAAASAKEQFIDYDIRAPWVNIARNSVLPFLSYTYRAVPLIAKAVATRPWKVGKYFTLAYLANAFAYALTGGDEDKERRSLQEKEQGRTWLGGYRMTRMPFNDKHGNPVFLDVRRWIPGGDVFDLSDGDIPAWMNIGGPLMIGAELALNRSAFTGKEIFNSKTDDWWDRQAKRADHLYKSWMPSAAYIPNSWYWEKVENAIKGATDRQGRPYSLPLALSSSVGIKLKPQDVQDAMAQKGQEFARIERALKDEARLIAQRKERGLISETEFGRQMSAIMKKLERLGERASETFK